MSIDVSKSFYIITGMNGFASLRLWVFALITIVLAHAVQAHPGHGLTERGFGHAVTSPFHLASLLLTAGALWVVARVARQTMVKRILQAGAALILLLALFSAALH